MSNNKEGFLHGDTCEESGPVKLVVGKQYQPIVGDLARRWKNIRGDLIAVAVP
jgi:hypothetical protein